MKLNKLVVPFFVVSLAAIGCSSSTTPGKDGGAGAAGTAGAGGHADGGTAGAGGSNGTAGAGGSVGTAGAGGSVGTAGAGGSNGTAGAGGTAGTAGAGGSVGAAGHDGGSTDSGSDAVVLPACSVTTETGTAELSAADFCTDFLAACSGVQGYTIPTPYSTQATCMVAYAASTFKHCQSYHLCVNSFEQPLGKKMMHCPHASGAAPCGP